MPGEIEAGTSLAFDPGSSLLLTDLYELNMFAAYLDAGMCGTAVFELFFRRLPPERNFLLAAGLESVLAFLERARFTPAENKLWYQYLKKFRFPVLRQKPLDHFIADFYCEIKTCH